MRPGGWDPQMQRGGPAFSGSMVAGPATILAFEVQDFWPLHPRYRRLGAFVRDVNRMINGLVTVREPKRQLRRC